KFYLKKILRPLIPDRLMARIRMRQHSKDVRWNVDVFPLDSRQAGRWRDSTPDTYRVRLDRPAGTPRDDVEVIVDPAFPTPEDVRDLAVRLLADPWLGAVAAGRSEEHTSELQSREKLVCRLLLEKKKKDVASGYRDVVRF